MDRCDLPAEIGAEGEVGEAFEQRVELVAEGGAALGDRNAAEERTGLKQALPRITEVRLEVAELLGQTFEAVTQAQFGLARDRVARRGAEGVGGFRESRRQAAHGAGQAARGDQPHRSGHDLVPGVVQRGDPLFGARAGLAVEAARTGVEEQRQASER